MSKISEFEKEMIREFLKFFPNGEEIAFGLAKTITDRSARIVDFDSAIEIICVASSSCHSLLSRKTISKEMLFKYLSHYNSSVLSASMTKANLIDNIFDYWKSTRQKKQQQQHHQDTNCNYTPPMHGTNIVVVIEHEFPVNVMARQFAEWFFENLNKDTIQISDFWSDANLHLRLIENSNIVEEMASGSRQVYEKLKEFKQQYNLYLNANLTHDGVQGRIDNHGLVYVLACGTIHTIQLCVGVFEAAFGLARDPFSENNWKIKTLKLQLINKMPQNQPSLQYCDSLEALVKIPQLNIEL